MDQHKARRNTETRAVSADDDNDNDDDDDDDVHDDALTSIRRKGAQIYKK